MPRDSDGPPSTDWGIFHRVLQEEEEHHLLRLVLTGVPEGIGREALKEALEKAGRTYGEGPYLWGNHKLLPREQWLPDAGVTGQLEPVETQSFRDLVDEANGEKRVTLRLPIGLHAALVKAAEGRSFNQFCVDTLHAALYTAREGNLEVVPEGWGFLRDTVSEPSNQDVYVSRSLIARFGLKSGDRVRGEVRPPRGSEMYYGLLRVKSINGQTPAADC